MAKLSRKGSSSKFQLPGFGSRDRDRGSSGSGGFFSRDRRAADSADEEALATEPPTPGLPPAAGSASVTGSPLVGAGGDKDKKGDRSSGLSWSSLRRKKKAPSINESVASERTEDEEELADARAPEGLGVMAIRE